MNDLELILAPNPIFRKVAESISDVNEMVKANAAAMLEILYHEKGIGLAANMVGLLERIIVVDLQEEGVRTPFTMINPIITQRSDGLQLYEEASLSFPGISAQISRHQSISVSYIDLAGQEQSQKAEGWLAAVIQHEMDYLDGRTYLDHLKPVKRQMLMKKYQKAQRQAHHHHGHACGDPNCDL